MHARGPRFRHLHIKSDGLSKPHWRVLWCTFCSMHSVGPTMHMPLARYDRFSDKCLACQTTRPSQWYTYSTQTPAIYMTNLTWIC